MNEYIIVGDTQNYKDCLVCVCGTDRSNAEKVLLRMKNNPEDNDKAVAKGHTNLRIKEVAPKDCWWDDPFLAN